MEQIQKSVGKMRTILVTFTDPPTPQSQLLGPAKQTHLVSEVYKLSKQIEFLLIVGRYHQDTQNLYLEHMARKKLIINLLLMVLVLEKMIF